MSTRLLSFSVPLVVALGVLACGEDSTGSSPSSPTPDTRVVDDGDVSDAISLEDIPTHVDTSTDMTVEVAPDDATGPLDGGDDSPTDPLVDAAPEDATDGDADRDGVDLEDGTDGDDADRDGADDTDPAPEPLFDLPAIRDATTADCRFENPRTETRDLTLLDVWDVSYRSWESIDGTLQPIRIRGFAARPRGQRGLPGVVSMHGLGGFAEASHATGTAARLGVFVLTPTGPGGGNAPSNTSEGRPSGYDDGRRMFDTIPDPRGSWFWGHAVAAMRGITCLSAHPDVDGTRLGMTGYSAGGVATLLSAGVDNRLVAAVPLSSSGYWDAAIRSPNAWQWTLLSLAGLTDTSAEWVRLMETLDPGRVAAGTDVPVMMINGSTDEFFPLNAHVQTLVGLGNQEASRTSIVANFDHGCFSITGGEGTRTIEARAQLRLDGGQRAFFAHHFGTDPTYRALPTTPTVQRTLAAGGTIVAAVVDPGGTALEVDRVDLWASTDALVWATQALTPQGGGLYGAAVPLPIGDDVLSFVDVTYRRRGPLGQPLFSISSVPHIPAGHVPNIRSITNCAP